MDRKQIVYPENLTETPEWAEAIVAAAMKVTDELS